VSDDEEAAIAYDVYNLHHVQINQYYKLSFKFNLNFKSIEFDTPSTDVPIDVMYIQITSSEKNLKTMNSELERETWKVQEQSMVAGKIQTCTRDDESEADDEK